MEYNNHDNTEEILHNIYTSVAILAQMSQIINPSKNQYTVAVVAFIYFQLFVVKNLTMIWKLSQFMYNFPYIRNKFPCGERSYFLLPYPRNIYIDIDILFPVYPYKYFQDIYVLALAHVQFLGKYLTTAGWPLLHLVRYLKLRLMNLPIIRSIQNLTVLIDHIRSNSRC